MRSPSVTTTTRTSEDVRELLARLPDGRRVDDRHELVDVVDHRSVEQPLVSILERAQRDISLNVDVLASKTLEDPVLLAVHDADPRGQEPAQPESFALLDRERRRLVRGRMKQQVRPVGACAP